MRFCITASYVPSALAAMRTSKETNRRDAVEKLVSKAGGSLEAIYGTIQEGVGTLAIIDVEDTSDIAAIIETITATGALRNIQVQPLLSIEEVTESRTKAGEIHSSYKTPGQQ